MNARSIVCSRCASHARQEWKLSRYTECLFVSDGRDNLPLSIRLRHKKRLGTEDTKARKTGDATLPSLQALSTLFHKNRVNSLSLLFGHSSSNSVFLEAKCTRCLHSLLIHLPISSLPVICFELLITRTFFDFPRRFES